MDTIKFAAYIDIENGRITPVQLYEAIQYGLLMTFKGDTNATWDIQVYQVPPVDVWQPGHLNTQTAVEQKKHG